MASSAVFEENAGEITVEAEATNSPEKASISTENNSKDSKQSSIENEENKRPATSGASNQVDTQIPETEGANPDIETPSLENVLKTGSTEDLSVEQMDTELQMEPEVEGIGILADACRPDVEEATLIDEQQKIVLDSSSERVEQEKSENHDGEIKAVPEDENSASKSATQVTDEEKETSASSKPQSLYHIKWIQWKGINTPIITQNENGPCPLLAIINVLLLQRRISIPPMQEIISSAQLMEYLGDCILEQAPERLPEGAQLNYEQNMHDAIGIMYKLQTGLDVNVKFTGVAEFEFTPECVVFDLLNVKLLHGWLVEPQNEEVLTAVGSSSYNQLVEKIIASKQEGASSQLLSQGLMAEAFLEQTASQLTYHGLYELNSQMEEEELCVFFRNNHFNTLYKHKKELFLLATDQGYLTEDKVVWETLSNVEGDGYFVDASFRTVSQQLPASAEVASPPPLATAPQGISQEDQDYLVALTLQEEQAKAEASQREVQTQAPIGTQGSQPPQPSVPPQGESRMSPQEWSDLQLAMQLQEEERRQQEQEQQIQQQQQQQQRAQSQQSRGPPTASVPRDDNPPVPQRPQATQQSSNDKCTIL